MKLSTFLNLLVCGVAMGQITASDSDYWVAAVARPNYEQRERERIEERYRPELAPYKDEIKTAEWRASQKGNYKNWRQERLAKEAHERALNKIRARDAKRAEFSSTIEQNQRPS